MSAFFCAFSLPRLPVNPCNRDTLGPSNKGRAELALYEFRICWIQELVNCYPYGLRCGWAARGRAAQRAQHLLTLDFL